MNDPITVEQVDAAIRKATERGDVPVDDVALLWITKAHLLGLNVVPEHLQMVMGLSMEEAQDVIARLSEHGYVEEDA